MKNCTYDIKIGNEEYKDYSYEQMFDLLKENQTAYSILYAKSEEEGAYVKQKLTFEKLEELKSKGLSESKESKKLSSAYQLGDDVEMIDPDGDNYTTQTLVDSKVFADKTGQPLVRPYNEQEYLKEQRAIFESQGLPQEEIDAKINLLRDKSRNIAKDAYDLHKIILKEYGKSHDVSETFANTEGTSFKNYSNLIHGTIYPNIIHKVFRTNGKTSRESEDDSSTKVMKNITLSAPLDGYPGKSVYAHIDYIAVKPTGAIEIFLIKTTHESPSSWNGTKYQKYQYEAALLLQILKANGIDISDASVNLIPVVLNYEEDYKSINGITVDQCIPISHLKGGFILAEEMAHARRFITSTEQEIEVKDESLNKVTKQLSALFPESDIRAQGIKQTAEEYVDKNWDYIVQKQLLGGGYEIILNDVKYTVKDSRRGKENEEIVKLVRQYQDLIMDGSTGFASATHIANAIKDGRRYGKGNLQDSYLQRFFDPYYEVRRTYVRQGVTYNDYKWEIVSNKTLEAANIILFKNKDTEQLDIVVLSPQNLRQIRKFKGRTNILGYHLSDMRAQDNQGHELLNSSNGSIEVMRGLYLLNELMTIPELKEAKLGDIKVVGGLGTGTHGLVYPISLVLPNFIKSIKILNAKEKDLNIENNFQKIKHINPAQLLLEEFSDVLCKEGTLGAEFDQLKELFYGTGYNENGNNSKRFDAMIHRDSQTFQSLQLAISQDQVDIQIARLEEIINKLATILKTYGGGDNVLNPDVLIANSKGRTGTGQLVQVCSALMIQASIALDRLSGNIRIAKSDLATLDSMLARPQNMEDSQVRIVSKLLQDAIHQVSSKLDPVISEFNELCKEYYAYKGYTDFRNFTIGDQVKVFQNLFRESKEELMFINPYDPTCGLQPEEQKFLKRVLFIIAKIRFKDKNFNFKDENAPGIQDFINRHSPQYFFVPLEKASQSTQWTNPGKFFEDFARRTVDYCRNPSVFFREMYEGIMSDEENEVITKDMYNLQTRNPFRVSDTTKGRKYLLQRYGKDTFETNLQNLIIDYAFRHLQEEEMNKMLLRARGILLYLKITGTTEESGKKKYADTIKHIDDYLTTSVFGKSIMQEDSKKIIAKISPIRKAISAAYIAVSPVAAVRDVIQGFLGNLLRSGIKFRTDIDVKDVLWAYDYVITRGVTSIGKIDLMDKMNAKYLISNINIEQQQEGYKTNTHGITNPGNLAYATLRKPDYLNRMVLFIAKLKHDGSLDAYSVVNGQLQYNWKMDKRFSLLKDGGDTSNLKEYNKQKALKLSLILALNKENPGLNLQVDVNTDLPDGYTNQEIESIKSLGDSIYGSYNRSTKAMYEHLALGSQFGYFSTWMNGIYDVYFGKRHESSYQYTLEQAEDENGNLLYFDENNNLTTEKTDTPYYKYTPMMVQGVLRTLTDIVGDIILHKGENLNDIFHDPSQLMNIRRLISDFIAYLVLVLLFKYAITPAYKEHKKEDDGRDVLTNGIIEIIYKGSSSSFDEVKGPLAILEYVGNNTNPAAYKWMSRTGNDLFKLATGDRSLSETVMRSQALFRSCEDTYKMYMRDTANGVE